MSKVIIIDVTNEVRKLCFGGALLRAVFLEKVMFLKKYLLCEKVDFCSCELPTLRVGRPVTRLTVHWAFPSRAQSLESRV